MALKELIRHSAIYGISDSFSRLIGFLLIPLYTGYLITSEYGIYEVILVALAASKILVSLSLGSALFREILLNQGYDEITLVSTAWVTQIALALLVALILIFKPIYFSNLFLANNSYSSLIILLAIVLIAEVTKDIPLALLRIYDKSWQFGLTNFTGFLAQMILNILFLMVWNWKVEGLLIGFLVSRGLMAIMAICFSNFPFPRHYSFPALLKMLKFSIPLIPIGLAFFVLNLSDRFLMLHFRSAGETGTYALGYKLGTSILIIVEAFQLAWPRLLYGMAENEPQKAPDFYARVLRLLTLAVFIPGFAISLFSREIVMLISTPSYYEAFVYIPPVILASIFVGAFYAGAVGVNLLAKTYLASVAVLIGAVLNVGLNIILIPRWGGLAAAWTTAASFGVMATLTIWFSVRIYPVPYEFGKIIKPVLLGIVLAALVFLFSPAENYIRIIIQFVSLSIVVIYCWRVSLSLREKDEIKEFILNIYYRRCSVN